MRNSHRFLSVLLALMLANSNVAFSGHASSHVPSDSGLCVMCMHHGGSDNAIAPESSTFFITLPTLSPDQGPIPNLTLPIILHDHPSRAPPSVT